MRNQIIILLTILSPYLNEPGQSSNYIEDYYQSIYLAEIEYRIGNYRKAFELYQDAFRSCKPRNTRLYNEIGNFAHVSAILGEYDLTLKFLKKNIQRGYTLKDLIDQPDFKDFFKSKQGISLISEYDYLRKRALSNLNLSLRQEILEMQEEDQKYRNADYRENVEKQREIDNYNTKRLIEIFESFGFPDESLIGSYSVDNKRPDVHLLLLHTPDSIRMNYFVPKLKEFVKNGSCDPYILGTLIDQFHLYNDDPQIYGTYGAQGGGYAKMISDLKQVNKNRISIGLQSLELKEKRKQLLGIN